MSIQVNNITKLYGTQKALNNVSFEVGSNEIVGFLGPNGAGKSTMMKILTCYIPPTEGSAKVCGFDIIEQSLEVRKQIGYLPEHNPLYKDMYVREYLEFVAGLHHLSNKKQRVADMIERAGLKIGRGDVARLPGLEPRLHATDEAASVLCPARECRRTCPGWGKR